MPPPTAPPPVPCEPPPAPPPTAPAPPPEASSRHRPDFTSHVKPALQCTRPQGLYPPHWQEAKKTENETRALRMGSRLSPGSAAGANQGAQAIFSTYEFV